MSARGEQVRLGMMRHARHLRASWHGRRLRTVVDRTAAIRRTDVLLFVCLRNEAARIDHFLRHYRRLGVRHVLAVDNGSTDGTAQTLADQGDVSLWSAPGSYAAASFGVDWLNALRRRHGLGHWCLTVDADELLVYPHWPTRPLEALTGWLDETGRRSFPALLVDTYPKGPIGSAPCRPGADPLDEAPYFDAGNYIVQNTRRLHHLWIRGGPRARCLFPDDPEEAPALNKIPLVRWSRKVVYRSSTHALLPRGMNRCYVTHDGEGPSGCLLHPKYLSDLQAKSRPEARAEHYDHGREYAAYATAMRAGMGFWTNRSARYRDWRQLVELGLMSGGAWA